jgi:hypothetical protein
MVIQSRRNIRRSRSFALADCIVATVILGSGLAVMVGLTGRALSSQTLGQELATAAALADEQLNLVLMRGPDDYARRFPVQGACDPPFSDYRFALSFTGGGSTGDPYSVRATISWTSTGLGSAGIPRSVSVDTRVATRSGNPDGDQDPERRPAESINRTVTE